MTMNMPHILDSKTPAWLSAKGPEADLALGSVCALSRNLADFPFPHKCTPDELATVESRVAGVLRDNPSLPAGRYLVLDELGTVEIEYLLENQLVDIGFVQADGPRGVYISDDESLSVFINGDDHVTVRACASGRALRAAWERISAVEDSLTQHLDFAFHERLGYLTSAINRVGTGLHGGVALHLPALEMTGKIAGHEEAQAGRYAFTPFYPWESSLTVNDAIGSLFLVSNESTLGRSEEEIVFRLNQMAGELIELEHRTRHVLRDEAPLHLEDQVGRARGTAAEARLMALDEALTVLSSLRLGRQMGLDGYPDYARLNKMLLGIQPAHLQLRQFGMTASEQGDEVDAFTMSKERADLLRTLFR